jgi:hypothetical protein
MIDIVTVKGSIEPLVMFTIDLDCSNLELDPYVPKLNRKDLKIKRVRQRI